MDQSTASYYRSILFHDGEDQRPLPPTLCLIHAWAFKRFQAMGSGSVISKQAALCVAMTWMSTTKEGQAFAREFTEIGYLFYSHEEETPAPANAIDWSAVTPETKVVVVVDRKPTIGEFLGHRAGWVDVRVGGVSKPFKSSQVKLSGA